MEIKKAAIILIYMICGSFILESKELKIIENKPVFRANWGTEDNQLYYESNPTGGRDWIPNSFLIFNDYIIIRQQTPDSSEIKYFNIKNKSIQTKRFEEILAKYRYNSDNFLISPGFPRKCGSNIAAILGIYDRQDYSTGKLLLVNINFDNFDVNILNEHLPKKEFDDKSFFHVTANGGSFISQSGDLSYYNEKGKLISEIRLKNVMYTDKYGNIYIRENENKIGLYSIHNKRIAYFEVPLETADEFDIDGGDVDSYLYQWKWDLENLDKGEYYARIHLYKLEMIPKSDKWFIYYKGFITLGICHDKGKSQLFRNVVYDKMNYIDYEKELLQIDPDGTIYHAERDENEFRIIMKKTELPEK